MTTNFLIGFVSGFLGVTVVWAIYMLGRRYCWTARCS